MRPSKNLFVTFRDVAWEILSNMKRLTNLSKMDYLKALRIGRS